jgi:hypothetical protein
MGEPHILAAFLTAALLLGLCWRFARLDGGSLHGDSWLEKQLRKVHSRAAFRLFSDCALGVHVTAWMLLLALALAPRTAPDAAPGLVGLRDTALAWIEDPSSLVEKGGGHAIVAFAFLLLLLLIWTFLAPLFSRRHDWIRSVRSLAVLADRDEVPRRVARVCRRLAHCSNGVLLKRARPMLNRRRRPLSLAHLWVLMLRSLRHQDLAIMDPETKKTLGYLRGEVHRVEKASWESQEPLFHGQQLREDFGDSVSSTLWAIVHLVVAYLVYAAAMHILVP